MSITSYFTFRTNEFSCDSLHFLSVTLNKRAKAPSPLKALSHGSTDCVAHKDDYADRQGSRHRSPPATFPEASLPQSRTTEPGICKKKRGMSSRGPRLSPARPSSYPNLSSSGPVILQRAACLGYAADGATALQMITKPFSRFLAAKRLRT